MSTATPTTSQHTPAQAQGAAATAAAPVEVVGLLAEFTTVDGVMSAVRRIRREGYTCFDVHSPFPIHGIDAAMGIRPTILPWLVLGAGLFGLTGALVMQWWMNAVDYPFLISGKPAWSLPANIPIIFECTVLCAAYTAVFGMLALNRLPMLHNPLFKSERFRRVTNDRFFLVIDAADPLFSEQGTADVLRAAGAVTVEKVEDEP
jgi:hypothetical protein